MAAANDLQVPEVQNNEYEYQLKDREWRKKLSSKEYKVLRKKGTERARSGKYDKLYPKSGYFACKGCGQPLYSYKSKYNSGSGWPAFDMCYEGAVDTAIDRSYGMRRVEILCSKCGGHLGHVFDDGYHRTKYRHCVNSVCLTYCDGAEPETLKEEVLDTSKSTAKGTSHSSGSNAGCLIM